MQLVKAISKSLQPKGTSDFPQPQPAASQMNMLCLSFCSQAKQTVMQLLWHLKLFIPVPQKKWQTLREVRQGREAAFPGSVTPFSLIPFQIVCKPRLNFPVGHFKVNMLWWRVCERQQTARMRLQHYNNKTANNL